MLVFASQRAKRGRGGEGGKVRGIELGGVQVSRQYFTLLKSRDE